MYIDLHGSKMEMKSYNKCCRIVLYDMDKATNQVITHEQRSHTPQEPEQQQQFSCGTTWIINGLISNDNNNNNNICFGKEV